MIKLRIKEQAEKRGIMNASQLQKALRDYSPNVYKWFNNDLTAFKIESIDRLCKVLKCTPNDLIEFQPDK